MINSVNNLPMVQGVNVQGANNNVTNPQPVQNNTIPNANLGGAEALAAYNKPFVSKDAVTHKLQPDLPTIMQPEAIKFLLQKGTGITNSAGVLNCIVEKNDKTTVVYTMDVLAPNDAISKIETFDNATGKLIRKQANSNIIEDGKMPQLQFIEITNYDKNGKEISGTHYDNGKLYSTWEREVLPDGTKKTYLANFEKNRTMISESNENTNIGRHTEFDKDGKLIKTMTRDFENYTTETVEYKDGHAIKAKEVLTNQPIPNTTGKYPLNDGDLKPTAPVAINYDPKQVQGEKLYYSNGELEAIRTTTANGVVVHSFAPNGTFTGIDYDMGKKSIFFGTDCCSISEEVAPNVVKTTRYYDDGTKEVTVADDKEHFEKTAFYAKDGHLECYTEYSKDSRLFMEFDKQGNLRAVE